MGLVVNEIQGFIILLEATTCVKHKEKLVVFQSICSKCPPAAKMQASARCLIDYRIRSKIPRLLRITLQPCMIRF